MFYPRLVFQPQAQKSPRVVYTLLTFDVRWPGEGVWIKAEADEPHNSGQDYKIDVDCLREGWEEVAESLSHHKTAPSCPASLKSEGAQEGEESRHRSGGSETGHCEEGAEVEVSSSDAAAGGEVTLKAAEGEHIVSRRPVFAPGYTSGYQGQTV